MNVDFINPFLSATVNVLETMAFIKTEPGKPEVKKDRVSRGDVTGLCGLAGDQLSGSFSISFSEAAILSIVSSMFGEPITTINDEIRDAVGEITNMISGGARRQLSEKGYKFNMAIPTIIVGKNHEVTHKTTGPAILLPFTISAGDFYIEICLNK
jgi:chemotaxis protein CheX